MPNPFVKLGTPVQSITDVERPQPVAPVLESVEGSNHPYRGTEEHGVADTVKSVESQSYAMDLDDLEHGEHFDPVEDDPKDPEPIPVRIVTLDRAKKELRSFGTTRLSVADANNTANAPVQLVARREGRASVRITNMDATKAVYVGRNPADVQFFGYPVLAGKEVVLITEEPIYATSADGTAVAIGILVEFPIREE